MADVTKTLYYSLRMGNKKIKKARGAICVNCRERVPYYFKRTINVDIMDDGMEVKTKSKDVYCRHCNSEIWVSSVEAENVRRWVRNYKQAKKEKETKNGRV